MNVKQTREHMQLLIDVQELRAEVETLKAEVAKLKPKRGRPRKTDG